MPEEKAQEAADESVNEDRLLEGEDPQTKYHEDAVHWVQVYTELLSVKRDLLGKTEEALPNLEPEARREIASTDLVVLDSEMKRFSRRLTFWRERCDQLSDSTPDPQPPGNPPA